MRQAALANLAGRFLPERDYTAQEVSRLLGQWHAFGDPATLRRKFCDKGFLDRDSYGKACRLADPPPQRMNVS